MTYVIGILLTACMAVLSYALGKTKAELKAKERESEGIIIAQRLRSDVKYNDEEAMSVDPFNRDNKEGEK